MGERTKIEWTDASWTPIRARHKTTFKVGWHCEHATPGCKFCYSGALNKRLGTGLPFKPEHRKDIELFLDEKMLVAPLRWHKSKMIFVCSMTDLFADFVPDEWIDRIFAVMALAPQHTFQCLTKRSARMLEWSRRNSTGGHIFHVASEIGEPRSGRWPLRNVWLGVSCEDQRRADERVPDLLATPAAVRFVSAEPLLSRIDFRAIDLGAGQTLDALTGCHSRALAFDGNIGDVQAALQGLGDLGPLPTRLPALDQIIVGGESGSNARSMRVEWARDIVEPCRSAGTACFVKQLGPKPIMSRSDAVQPVALGAGWDGRAGHECGVVTLRSRKGGDPSEWPSDLRVREMPEAAIDV